MQHETMSPETATEARAIVTLAGRELRDAVKLLNGKLVERRCTVPVLAAIHFDIAPDCAEAPTATDAAPMPEIVSVAAQGKAGDPIALIRARLAEVEAMLAALPAQSVQPKRTPAHERAIRRAWAERKAARAIRFNAQLARDMAENNKRVAEFQRDRADAVEAELQRVKAIAREARAERDKAMAAYNRSGDERRAMHKQRDDWQGKAQRADDARHLAEQIAEDHLQMREQMRGQLCAMERRAEMAEAENAELWAEIEALTALPISVQQGATPTQVGAA